MVRAHASRLEGLQLEPWIPGGNTGEIKAARKGTGHPTSHADGPA